MIERKRSVAGYDPTNVRCPHCMTDVPSLLGAPDECPHCGRALKDAAGHRVRDLDQDFPAISSGLDEQSLRRLKQGAIVCVVLSLANLVLPFFAPLIFIQQIIWARPLISAPYARHFSPSRRIVTRWLSRFFVFSMASLHVGGAVPGVHFALVIASPIVFVLTCGTTWAYHRFHLQREHDREPVMFVEKVLLVVGALCALLALAGMILIGLAVGGAISMFSK